MINKKNPPFKGLNIRIPSIITIQERGFINQGSGLGFMQGLQKVRMGSYRAYVGLRRAFIKYIWSTVM